MKLIEAVVANKKADHKFVEVVLHLDLIITQTAYIFHQHSDKELAVHVLLADDKNTYKFTQISASCSEPTNDITYARKDNDQGTL